MENETGLFERKFYETLEKNIEKLPQETREELYRPCAINCVQNFVLGEQKRQFEECNKDMDLQYEKYGRTEYFFGDIIERGRVYEMGYPRCLCPMTEDGYQCPVGHCECSRQSILYVLQTLSPDKKFKVEILHTVLSGANECRFRVTVLE